MNEYNEYITPLKNPSAKYGEVPFFWWNGEKLDRERLYKQLKALADNGVAGVQINYAHQYGGGETDAAYGGHGKTIPGDPYPFSDDWWELFGYAASVCEELGMGIGVGDYTIAWIGNGFFTDRVSAAPGMHAQTLTCEHRRIFCMEDIPDPQTALAVVTYTDTDCTTPRVLYEKGKDLPFPYGCYDAFILRSKTVPQSIDPLNENCGAMLVDTYFREFERRFPQLKKGTLNYFFQDELMFGAPVRTLWRDNLRQAISAQCGYDPLGFLPHLFYELGPMTAKIRLDLADVKTRLIEENYFRPIYDFHASRGLIYGCDQSGRGRQPDEFSDYFRTVRWFTAPGNDTPGRAADLIKVKINASIADLYDRPRVWLEGYHSSGWGTSLASITAPTSDNFLFGANLLNLHGLYYTTNGGFFEWAPPDFHFRMPYWDDEKVWLSKYKSLSALLTTGKHICDVAVFYPVSSFDYGEHSEECINDTFSTAQYLFDRGVDFTFIDFQSIERAEIKNGLLVLPEAQFQAVVLCSVDCIRYSTLQKLCFFAENGGCVIFKGITPYLSDLLPRSQSRLSDAVAAMLACKNTALCQTAAETLGRLNAGITRLFLPDGEDPSPATHCTARTTEGQTLFFLRGCTKNAVCRFQTAGQPFLLDAYTKKIYRLTGTISAGGFTFVKLPLETNEDTLLLFTDDYIPFDEERNTSGFAPEAPDRSYPLDGEWDFSLLPTLDNTYGDFYRPAGGMIGAEARFFRVWEETQPAKALQDQPYCHSRNILWVPTQDVEDVCRRCSVSASLPPEDAAVLPLHDRYGYIHPHANTPPSLYEQGFHGLKGKVCDHNLYFSQDGVFLTDVLCEKETTAYFYLIGVKPDLLYLNGVRIEDPAAPVTLPTGKTRLAIGFYYDPDLSPDYINRAGLKRAGVYLCRQRTPKKTGYPLSTAAFANPDFLAFTPVCSADDTYLFSFIAAPGTCGLTANLFGTLLEATLNGKPMQVERTGAGHFDGKVYTAKGEAFKHAPLIQLRIRADAGTSFTGIIPEPIKLLCDTGKTSCGDWAQTGALKCYSGKAVYKKSVRIKKYETDTRFLLELGDVRQTAAVKINGAQAAVLTYPPYTCDVTDLLADGENEIEITVANTLCNHYATVPSGYANYPEDAASGLLGPVLISVWNDLE